MSHPDKDLLQAVLDNDCALAVDALAQGANALRPTTNNISCFELSLRMGQIDIVAAMLHAGVAADFQAVAGVSRTALSYAVAYDVHDFSCARTALMLSYGANPDARFDYQGKKDCTVDDVLAHKQAAARVVEEVTIGDLREMIAQRRQHIAQERIIANRKAMLAQARKNGKLRL